MVRDSTMRRCCVDFCKLNDGGHLGKREDELEVDGKLVLRHQPVLLPLERSMIVPHGFKYGVFKVGSL